MFPQDCGRETGRGRLWAPEAGCGGGEDPLPGGWWRLSRPAVLVGVQRGVPIALAAIMSSKLSHDAVVAALQARLGDYWTVTVRSATPDAPLIAMFSGALQKAEPKDDAPPGETDFVWYVGQGDRTFGAFAIPAESFGSASWETTPRGPSLMVHASHVQIALFPRSVHGA